MSDFAEAFKQGQEAATRAARARTEIKEVLREFSRDVEGITDGLLSIKVSEFNSLLGSLAFFPIALTDPSTPPPGVEQWIVASNVTMPNSDKRLAKWQQSHSGYPCTLTVTGKNIRCHDREALESALQEFLMNPWVGEQLQMLLALKPDPGVAAPNSDQTSVDD